MMIEKARGAREAVQTGITATTTSKEYKSNGNNAMHLYFNMTAGAGTWTIKIQGKSPSGIFTDTYDNNGALMGLESITADRAQLIKFIPERFRIVATEDVNGATVSVGFELLTV